MTRHDVINLIVEIAGEPKAFDILAGTFASISRQVLSSSLLECAIIPELFNPSSSEEKLWAKYCDILLAHALSRIGIPAEVLRTRGDSADVFGKTATYSIVADAKAFRLSRTAKNQKDFKISALDDWRKSDTYACLVGPLFQFPSRMSQIYSQAIQRNVTLLSYIHLKFLVDHFKAHKADFIWVTPTSLPVTKDAVIYWHAVDKVVCEIVNQPPSSLEAYKMQAVERTKELGQEGIDFWEAKIESYHNLSQQEAVRRLIKAEKIQAKIRTIRRAMDIQV